MSGNLLVINVDIREVRVALIEDGIIAELHIERLAHRSTLGNVYLGKVSRVLPGMQAAFIDIGQERAAFLHVEDLIRPDDFEQYLAHARDAASGGSKEDRSESVPDEDVGASLPETVAGLPAPVAGTANGAAGAGAAVDGAAVDPDGTQRRRRRRRRRRGGREGTQEDGQASGTATDSEGDEAGGDDESVADPDDVVLEASADDAKEDESLALTFSPQESEEGDEDGDGLDVGPSASLRSREAHEQQARAGLAVPGLLRDYVGEDYVSDDRAEDDASDEDATAEGALAPAASDDDELEIFVLDEGSPIEEMEEPRATAILAAEGRYVGEVEGANEAAAATSASGEPVRVQREGHPPGAARSVRTRRSASTASTVAPQAAAGAGTRSETPATGRDDRRGRNDRKRGREGREGREGRQGTKPPVLDKSRISKSTPIREVVREGQHVIVQVTKEPIGTKGARVSSHVSLAGRYVVFLPTVEHIGISKRIGNEKERARLREVIESVKPPTGGLVVRTVAESLTKKGLKNDIGYLVRLWDEIIKARDAATKAPTEIYEELDLVLKTARDLFTDDVAKIIIDNREQYGRLRRFVEMFMPERVNDIELYEGREPVFDAYGIEDEISRALSRKVPLGSGGHLVIDQAEALTAIDVNTGRFVGKGNKDLEDTILATNLEAVEEIAYQLRFRNIGGLIILDLIDMDRLQNREKVRRRLEDLLAKDKAKTTLNRISDLGLIEMTRKRTRESLGRLLHEPCFYCDGTGQLMSKATIAYEILRQIRREQSNLKGYKVVVNCNPAIVDLLKTEEQEAVKEAERMFMRRIDLVPHKEYHLEQFDLQGG